MQGTNYMKGRFGNNLLNIDVPNDFGYGRDLLSCGESMQVTPSILNKTGPISNKRSTNLTSFSKGGYI